MSNPFELNPESLWLETSEETQKQCWEKASSFLLPNASPLVYLNFLSQTVILPEMIERFSNAQLVENQSELWELGINGFALSIDDQRLVVVPSDALDLDEFRIPQEWIDIPSLAADYYLATQVDTAAQLIRVWGYTTHQVLKEQGHYDGCDRTYSLERDDVNENLNGLWLTRQYFSEVPTQRPIAAFPKLSLDTLTHNLETLGNPELIFPRRKIPFDQWATILENEQWRRMLLERRRPQTQTVQQVSCLTKWFDNQFEAGWQTIQDYIAPHLVGSFMIAQIKRAKLLDLSVELLNQQVALMITLGKVENAVTIQASVYPTGEQSTLPPHLTLSILTEMGEVFKEVTSRSDDEFIRYKFDAQTGDRFDVKITLGAASVTETFQV